MEEKISKGEITAQKPEVQSNVVSFYMTDKFGHFPSNRAKFKREVWVAPSKDNPFVRPVRFVAYGLTEDHAESQLSPWVNELDGVVKTYKKVGSKWVEIADSSEVNKAIDAFILNYYGFLKDSEEYCFVRNGVVSLMSYHGFMDPNGEEVLKPMSVVNYLSNPQFQDELKSSLASRMAWEVEMGGRQLDIFVNCK